MTITRISGFMPRVGFPAAVVAMCIALAGPGTASAAADVGIASLDCDGDPEVIELANSGDESQDMTGWGLVSDPVAGESYDLTPLGTVAAGSSVFIESGSVAEATFTWSTQEIFRDGDAGDFVRLVDPTGATVSEASCTAGAQATPAPTNSPTLSPAPVDDVPNGGGPPAAASDTVLTPITAVVAGASFVAVGGATFLGLWLAGAATLWKPRELTIYEPPPLPPSPVPRRRSRRSQVTSKPILIVLVVTLCGAIILMLLTPGARRSK